MKILAFKDYSTIENIEPYIISKEDYNGEKNKLSGMLNGPYTITQPRSTNYNQADKYNYTVCQGEQLDDKSGDIKDINCQSNLVCVAINYQDDLEIYYKNSNGQINIEENSSEELKTAKIGIKCCQSLSEDDIHCTRYILCQNITNKDSPFGVMKICEKIDQGFCEAGSKVNQPTEIIDRHASDESSFGTDTKIRKDWMVYKCTFDNGNSFMYTDCKTSMVNGYTTCLKIEENISKGYEGDNYDYQTTTTWDMFYMEDSNGINRGMFIEE